MGLRLKAFVDAFGAGGSFYSICANDFAPMLTDIGKRLAAGRK